LEKIDVTFYQNKKRESLEDYPLINGDLLGQHSLITDQAFLSPQAKSGYIYSSGGSTGGAKFCFYSYPEFKNTCDLLAKSYQGLGLNSSDKVGNLFMAANMWSSFNAIQEALEICQTVQFPMGGQVSVKDFEFYIKSFDIKILFGVPSLLFSLARETAGLKIEKIFYAGEIMNDKYKEVFEKNWGCREFYSAGYASVDVGPIGYQTKDCKKNEHYLFEGIILEVINEEAVITSTLRKMMPVIRYQTGDRVKIISQDDKGTKFKLLGRVDRLLFIWGARIELRHFEQALKHQGIGEDLFQIDLDINKGKETLILRSKEYIEKEKFITSLLEYSDDLARTQKMSFLEDHIKVFMEDLIIHPKTAKMCQLRDFR
jgi:phenylacetate-coenzyme A ligase PaaK-like adenylate-forming protein